MFEQDSESWDAGELRYVADSDGEYASYLFYATRPAY